WAHVRGIVRPHITGEQEPVAPNAGVDRDVLPAVRTRVRDRIADDAGTHLELPEQRAALRIDRLEPPVERSVEHDVTARGEHAAPHGILLPDLPHLAA